MRKNADEWKIIKHIVKKTVVFTKNIPLSHIFLNCLIEIKTCIIENTNGIHQEMWKQTEGIGKTSMRPHANHRKWN